MEQRYESSVAEFYRLLEEQYEYLSNGGTDYRIKTAELSLVVAKKYNQIQPFLDQENAKLEVQKQIPKIDQDRLNDVSKMLNVNAREALRRENQSPETKKMIRERMENFKSLKLKKVKE